MTELRVDSFVTLYQDGRDFVIIHNVTLETFGRYKQYKLALKDFKELSGGRTKKYLAEFSKSAGGWGKRNAA